MSQAGILKIAGSGPGVPVETLQGNSGGKVSPDGTNNIQVIGDGTTVNVVGNPGTHTLTISATSGITDSFVTDSGTAVPIANVLHINGDANISTTGATNVVGITLDQDVVVTSYSTATPTPIASSLLISGNTIQAAGTGSDVNISIASKGAGFIGLTGANTNLLVGNTDIDLETTSPSGDVSIATANASILLTPNNAGLSAPMGTVILIGNDIAVQPVNQGAGSSTITGDMVAAKVDTTDATVTQIISLGLGVGTLGTVEYDIQASCITTGTDSLFAKVYANAAYYTGAGSAALIGVPVIDINTTNLSASVTSTVVGNNLVIQVTGIVAQTWRWTAQGIGYTTVI